jgi:hypothetical protein
MTKAKGGESLTDLVPVMTTHVMPLGVTAAAMPAVAVAVAPVPAVAMAVTAVHMTAMGAAVPDLNHRTVLLRGEWRDPRQGGSGQGHCQRSNHRRADQNDTSHQGSSHRRIAVSDASFLTGFCSAALP